MSTPPHPPTQSELDLLTQHIANHAELKMVRTGYNRMTLPAIKLQLINCPFEYRIENKMMAMALKEHLMDIIIRKLITDAGGDLTTTLYSLEAFHPHLQVDSDFKNFYQNKPEKKRLYQHGLSTLSISALDNLLKTDKKYHMAFVFHVYLW